MAESLISPDWPAPSNVKACITTRQSAAGGSRAPFDSNNMGLHVGDCPETVRHNREALLKTLNLSRAPQWLEQVHGDRVVEALPDQRVRTADGCFSRQPGQACVVMTADCLPVLICNQAGDQVAAIHAGWRGLATGILGKAVGSFDCSPGELLVYLGPAISAKHFEVGVEVLEAFFEAARSPQHAETVAAAFKPARRPLHFYADIYNLARAELVALGVFGIYGGDYCTYADQLHFYSYRRDGQTGRMASLIWLD